MRKWFIALIAAASMMGCVAQKDRLNIHLYNKSKETIRIKAKAWIFGRDLKLKPGEEWHGWVPRNFIPESGVIIKVDVIKKKIEKKVDAIEKPEEKVRN